MFTEKFYDERVHQFGRNIKAVGWRSTEQQQLRFEVLLKDFSKSLGDILDVGCGFGDLLMFLEQNDFNFKSYMGIDVSNEMVNIAKKENGDLRVDFLQTDFFEFKFKKLFDLILMSGSLNLKLPIESLSRVELFFKKTSLLLKKDGNVTANFLSNKVDFEQINHEHYPPNIVLEIAEQYFSKVTLIENYGLYEFTIIGEGLANGKK